MKRIKSWYKNMCGFFLDLIFGSSEELLKDFQNTFGDRACPICSFARFGSREFGKNDPIELHKCPEESERNYRGEL